VCPLRPRGAPGRKLLSMCNENPIQTIGICGLGQMGSTAAVSYKRAGYHVLACDRSREKREAIGETLSSLELWLDRHVGPALRDGGTIHLVDTLRPIDQESDLVMDCIAEDLGEKVNLFLQLTGAVQRGAVLTTTTSGLSITEIGRRSATAHLLVGTHFWNPAHLMPLVEIIRGQDTPVLLLDRVSALIRSIGKIPVVVNRDVPGFIGNRLLHAMWREAIHLVQEQVASPAEIDLVARLTFGLRMPAVGTLENMDLVGLDLVQAIHEYLLVDLADDHEPLRVLKRKVANGALGIKSGQGFYDWRRRDAQELLARRNLQIVRQLEFLREIGGLP
jgi:3-hydroxybutyryl-CoA dehydrogenase